MFLTLLETLKSDFRPNLRVHDLNCCRRLAFAFELNTSIGEKIIFTYFPLQPLSQWRFSANSVK